MNDPHVERLYYELEIAGPSQFSETEPFDVEQSAFCVHYAGKTVTVEMIEHHATAEAARAAVQPFLLAWEIDDALRFGRRQISFRFRDVDVIDRNPPPPPKPGDAQVVGVPGIASAQTFGSATIVVERPLPKPPSDFVVDTDVERLWDRWQVYQQGDESLQTTAGFCLSYIQEEYGGRRDAAKHFGISENVLDKIGELSHIGEATRVRKWTRRAPRPLTAQEQEWLETAIKALIRRTGELAAAPAEKYAQITLADLPM